MCLRVSARLTPSLHLFTMFVTSLYSASRGTLSNKEVSIKIEYGCVDISGRMVIENREIEAGD